jgi:predicted phosphodiesterase
MYAVKSDTNGLDSMKKGSTVYDSLDSLYKRSPVLEIGDKDRMIIFSDLHMGEGDGHDDFKHNAELFLHVMESEYLDKDFKLILNGDIEELQRYSYLKIFTHWRELYELFNEFDKHGGLFKLVGNHDMDFLYNEKISSIQHQEGLKLDYKGNSIFIFHGHQASKIYAKYNKVVGRVLKNVANPLGIKNYSVAYDSKKQYKIEKRAYNFSRLKGVVSIIGHTHRPLFESFSKTDFLRYQLSQIEKKLNNGMAGNKVIEQRKENYLRELEREVSSDHHRLIQKSLYSTKELIPALFNSGCVIGKRGFTGIEIVNGYISLVHFFDRKVCTRHLEDPDAEVTRLGNSDYYRMVLDIESLDSVFLRMIERDLLQ